MEVFDYQYLSICEKKGEVSKDNQKINTVKTLKH